MASAAITRRRYSAEQIDRALLELAVCGTSTEARRRLAAQGLQVSDRTLREWKQVRYPERYVEIAQQHARQVEEVIVQQARDTALAAAEVERHALAGELKAIKAGKVRDHSASARNASTVKGINVDKLLTLSGRPNTIVENRNADDLIRKLHALAPTAITVEGNAEEVPTGDQTGQEN
jgi:hypothetical protein